MFGRKRPSVDRRRALESLPVRNQAVEWKNEGEQTTIVLRRREDWVGRLLSLAFVVPRERKIELDQAGSYVWQQLDGQHTVSDLAEGLARKYKLNRKEAEVSLTDFLRKLGKRKLIAIAVPLAADRPRERKEKKSSNVGTSGD